MDTAHMKVLASTKPALMVDAAVASVSPIERLPTEILEIIFFYCLNLSLPRASLTLGRILSSFHLKTRLFETAFTLDCASRQLLYLEPLQNTFRFSASEEDEVIRLQNQVLEARWVKAEFFRRYIPIFLERSISALSGGKDFPIFLHRPVLVTNPDPDHDSVTKKRVFLTRAYPFTTSSIDRRKEFTRLSCKQIKLIDVNVLFGDDDQMTGQVHLADHQESSSTWVDSNGSPVQEEFRSSLECYIRSPGARAMLCCWKCYIPAKFLGGPWTKDQCNIVTMLCEAGAIIDAEDSTVREIALQGFFYALKDRNTKIIRYLIQWLRPGPEYLVYAAIYLGCPKTIVELMIRRLRDHWRNVHMSTLLMWASEKEEEGSYRGWWLFSVMACFPAHKLQDGEAWRYLHPEDPNSSPGSFVLISPGSANDRPYTAFEESSRPFDSYECVPPSLEGGQNDVPPQEHDSPSSEPVEVVSSSLKSDHHDGSP